MPSFQHVVVDLVGFFLALLAIRVLLEATFDYVARPAVRRDRKAQRGRVRCEIPGCPQKGGYFLHGRYLCEGHLPHDREGRIVYTMRWRRKQEARWRKNRRKLDALVEKRTQRGPRTRG